MLDCDYPQAKHSADSQDFPQTRLDGTEPFDYYDSMTDWNEYREYLDGEHSIDINAKLAIAAILDNKLHKKEMV